MDRINTNCSDVKAHSETVAPTCPSMVGKRNANFRHLFHARPAYRDVIVHQRCSRAS